MRSTTFALAAALAAATLAAPAGAQQTAAPAAGFVGTWEGALAVGAVRLRLGLDVERDSAGALRGVLTSIDQGSQKVPATVATRGDTLVVDFPMIRGGYSATLSPAGDSLRGTFRQVNGTLPLAMARVAAITAARRPQEPRPPFPYRTEAVSFESVPGVRLAGTVTLPAGAGPFPAVVFASGSGPQDRDETLLGHKPFLVIADHLARHGIASLRVDDRGTALSTGSYAAATGADFANDAEAAVHFLQGVPGIARDRVGILGHSEGGMVGPLVAARSKDVAFLVLLAAPGVRGDSLLALQTRAILATAGADSATIARTVHFNERVYAIALSDTDSATTAAKVRAAAHDFVASLPASERGAASEADLAQQAAVATMPAFRYLLAYEPRATLRRVRVPVLALDGTLDVQVPARENLPGIAAALREGGNRDYETVALPKLNHLFQTAVTGGVSEYAAIEETIAPAALDAITSWIAARFVAR